MFSTFDLIEFGEKVKEIRKSVGLSQRDVCSLCGINKDTLRKLENGLTIPRYDTLEILSRVYKRNILLILNQYKKSNLLFEFYDKIDYLLRKNNINEVKMIYKEFQHIKYWDINLINPNDIKQLNLFFQALQLSFSNEEISLESAVKFLIEALSYTNPNFDIENIKSNNYTYFELRILLLLGSIFGIQRKCQMSIEILKFVSSRLDNSKYSRTVEKELIIKSQAIISYNYHRLDDHNQALKHSEAGIDLCIKYDLLSNLPFLLFRKGIAMIILEKNNFDFYLKQSLNLLLIKEDYTLYEEYSNYLKNKYGLDFKDLSM